MLGGWFTKNESREHCPHVSWWTQHVIGLAPPLIASSSSMATCTFVWLPRETWFFVLKHPRRSSSFSGLWSQLKFASVPACSVGFLPSIISTPVLPTIPCEKLPFAMWALFLTTFVKNGIHGWSENCITWWRPSGDGNSICLIVILNTDRILWFCYLCFYGYRD